MPYSNPNVDERKFLLQQSTNVKCEVTRLRTFVVTHASLSANARTTVLDACADLLEIAKALEHCGLN